MSSRPGAAAAICRRGHVRAVEDPRSTDMYSPSLAERASKFCHLCGARVLLECPGCAAYVVVSVPYMTGDYEPRPFCDQCGITLPWAGRDDQIHALENILDEQEIDEGDRRLAQQLLEELRQAPDSEDQEVKLWARFKGLAPKVWDVGRPVLLDLISAEARRRLGLS